MARYEIARLEEVASFSGGGVAAVIMLIIINVLALFAFFTVAKSAVQEASIGTIWIALNVLFGAGAIIGRKRTYIVTREEQSPQA